ncbi:MAG: nucleotidyltransferase domain-containing protein [Pyrinomonadaceae bacterium]
MPTASTNRIDPTEAAQRIFAERHARASVLFLAGSVMRGEGTPTSDLDIVVVYQTLPNSYRESFMFEGWPVESFVHDPETLNDTFQEGDAKHGRPSLARMIVEGREIPAPSDFSASLKRRAVDFIAAGPPRWDEQDFRRMRYRLTDAVDDIRYPRTPEDLVATGAQLYELVSDFFLFSRHEWAASRKAIPPRLREVDADFAARFREAFESLFVEKHPAPVIALIEKMLEPFGGFLFDGYRHDAPATNRLTLEKDSDDG